MKGGEITMVKHLTNLFQELTTKEFAVAVVISSFVSDSGIIKHNGKEVTGKDICNMLGDNYETFNRVITKLTRKGILGRVRIPDEIFKFHELKHFCANPFIYEVNNPKKEIVEHFKKNINITNKGSCDFGYETLLCGKYPQNEIFISKIE